MDISFVDLEFLKLSDIKNGRMEWNALVGIEDIITSYYTARHTFATTAKFKKLPMAAISDALGHSDVRTTQIYLDQFDTDTMDAYNEFIIKDDI